MSATTGLVTTPHHEISPVEQNVLQGTGDSRSALSRIKLEPLTPGRLRLSLPMTTGEGKIIDNKAWQFTPIFLEGHSASSAYWGGLQELLGNVHEFMEEMRLTQWPMPFFRQVTTPIYTMTVAELLKWTLAYVEELKRLRVWRLRHARSSSDMMRGPSTSSGAGVFSSGPGVFVDKNFVD
jgi:hypothetical protein